MNKDEIRRVAEATLCADVDYIPKVPHAGTVRVDQDGNRVQVMHNGLVVLADGYYGEFITRIIEKMKGHHEGQQERVFHEMLKLVPPGSTMIELGAYWAYYSMWFQQAVPAARTFMIEPGESSIECGMKNFQLNSMRGEFTQAFVGRTSSNGWDQGLLRPNPGEVPQVCVRDFARTKGIDRIAILHSDIQGFEYDMLLGCGDLLDRKLISFVFISSHGLKVHFQCRKHLLRKSYSTVAEHTPKESYSEDGLIVASASPIRPIEISRRPVSVRQRLKALAWELLT